MKLNRHFPLFFLIFLITNYGFSQIPEGYYSRAEGKKGRELQDSLRSIIDGHKRIHYECSGWDTSTHQSIPYDTCLFKMFPLTDPAEEPGYDVYDMYYGCNFQKDDHGTGSVTNHCVFYEREHTFPKSLFGVTRSDAYTDLFNLYPADRVVNNLKKFNPFGEINPVACNHLFRDGSGVGPNCYVPPFEDIENFRGTVYEPMDAFKGDFARSLLYISIRYMREDDFWVSDPDSSAMADKSQFRPWILNMLIEWHFADPVSYKEMRRNNAVYAIQGNRNPLIDHPELVTMIWGSDSLHYTFSQTPAAAPHLVSFSQPAADIIELTFSEPMSPVAENFNIWPSHPAIREIRSISETTVQLLLASPLAVGQRYKCSLYNIINADHSSYMRDTILTLQYGFVPESHPIAGWTFVPPILPGKVLAADAICTDNVNAAIYFDGTHGSSSFDFTGNQIPLSGNCSFGNFCSSAADTSICLRKTGNNGKSFVIKCSTVDHYNIKLSFVSRYTLQAFKKMVYEWSVDGEFHPLSSDSLPLTDLAENWCFHEIDLSAIEELNNQDSIMLRITVSGSTSGNSNLSLDNIFVFGNHCVNEPTTVYYDTVYRGRGYEGYGFVVETVQTQQVGTRIFQRQVEHPDGCIDFYLLYLNVLEPSHVGINEVVKAPDQFVIYPNPASERVTVKGNTMRELSVYNSMGQRVAFQIVNAEQTSVNVSNFPAGLYIFSITTADGRRVMKKVIVK